MSDRITERVAAHFSHAASSYDEHAELQVETGRWLMEGVDLGSSRVLDLGCGTGALGNMIENESPDELIGIDLAAGLLKSASQSSAYQGVVCANMLEMPFRYGAFDQVVSNLAMQWAPDQANLLKNIACILKEQGELTFTVPLPGSLKEIEMAWRETGSEQAHINTFLSGDQWFELAEDAGFEVVLAEREWMRWFDSPINAVRSLKRVGANKVVSGAKTGLTGKHAYKQMLAQYENMREDQGIPLSYRILKAKMQLKRV